MKKWSLALKVFLILLGIGFLYVLIATIIRVASGEIDMRMAVGRFVIGILITLIVAGYAAGVTSVTVAVKQKRKPSIPLIVFLAGALLAVLYVLTRTLIRLNVGEITSQVAVARFIFGSILYVAGAAVLAGITKLVLSLMALGK